MKKKQSALQKLKTWWHNLPHKWFLVFQILFAVTLSFSDTLADHCQIYSAPIYPKQSYFSHFLCIIGLLSFLASPLLLFLQLFFIVKYHGVKALFLSVLSFGIATQLHLVFSAYIIIYLILTLMIQCNSLKKINYTVLATLIVFAILRQYLFISNTCSCISNTLCQTCMYDVSWQAGDKETSLFQISEHNFLHKMIRTKPW